MRQATLVIGLAAVIGLVGFGIVTATNDQGAGVLPGATVERATAERPLLGNSSRDIVDFAPTAAPAAMVSDTYIQDCTKMIVFLAGGSDNLGMDTWTMIGWCEKQYGYRSVDDAAGEFIRQWRNRS
jgi:hypothetical protein